jgi:transposase
LVFFFLTHAWTLPFFFSLWNIPHLPTWAVTKILHISVATVERTRKQFVQDSLKNTLSERSRPGKPRKLAAKAEAFLIATTCSEPPTGYQRWTLQLLADKLVRLEIVDSISADTVGRILKKTNLSLG